MFAHFGSLLFELLKVGRLSQAELLRLIEFEGDERGGHAYAQGKGVLFFTGHFGYWEIQAIAQPLVRLPGVGAGAPARQSQPARSGWSASAPAPATP